jgi:hypothetical protein
MGQALQRQGLTREEGHYLEGNNGGAIMDQSILIRSYVSSVWHNVCVKRVDRGRCLQRVLILS